MAPIPGRRRLLARLVGAWVASLGGTADVRAHDSRIGELVVDHAYALPSPPDGRSAAVYLRTLVNRGRQADRLVGARTPRAARVGFRRSTREGAVPDLRELPAIEIPADSRQRLRHDGDLHLVLEGLDAPLREGERFPLWLRFERAGELEVSVWVQRPREGAPAGHAH